VVGGWKDDAKGRYGEAWEMGGEEEWKEVGGRIDRERGSGYGAGGKNEGASGQIPAGPIAEPRAEIAIGRRFPPIEAAQCGRFSAQIGRRF